MLKKLQLTNWRNSTSRGLAFEPVTVFVGQNGVGKTNILEAISYLALARSWRTRQDKEIIHWDETAARLVGELAVGAETTTLEIVLNQEKQQARRQKLIKINGVSRRSIELLGHLTVILFLPESLCLVDGPPLLRRQFLDLLLIQRDRRYAFHLLQLQKVLRQRNQLLRQIDESQAEAGPDQLVFWDAALVEHGRYLLAQRVLALRAINKTIGRRYKTLVGQSGQLQLQYKAATVSESGGEQERYRQPADCPVDEAEWGRLLARSLRKYQAREIAAGASLYGPQRDDFSFILADRPLVSFGSRGEFRSAILALKAAEADYLLARQTLGEEPPPPLFLLDDVYSELDASRRGQLATLIGDHQTVITTTELSHLDPRIQKAAKIVQLP